MIDKFSITNNGEKYREIGIELFEPLSLIVDGQPVEKIEKTFALYLSPDQTLTFLVTSRDLGTSLFGDDIDRRVILSYLGKKLRWPIYKVPEGEAFRGFVAFFVEHSFVLLMTTVAAVLFLLLVTISTVSNLLPDKIKAQTTTAQTFKQYLHLAKVLRDTDPSRWKEVRKELISN